MNSTQIEATFDQQSATYDQQWAKLAPIRDGVHLLLASLLGQLPEDARMLCVGAGTGAEIHFLASQFPNWTFAAVEPSSGMVIAARERAAMNGYASRCTFHNGYLNSLPASAPFDCATSLLVSQFVLDTDDRSRFFAEIAGRLKDGGILASSDLASDVNSQEYPSLLSLWLRTMAASDVPPERLQQMQDAYARDVSILAPRRVASIIAAGGFAAPVQFYQAGLIHAWYTHRLPR